jgi:hypothetical protein
MADRICLRLGRRGVRARRRRRMARAVEAVLGVVRTLVVVLSICVRRFVCPDFGGSTP